MKKQLLAPNGKPSNLTSEQYKLVRTKAFKEWFGDWEILAKAEILSNDIKGVYKNVALNNIERFLFEISQQANSSDSEYKGAIETVGKSIVNLALKLFPNSKVGDEYIPVISKVVDENGEPLICYHRSKKIFHLFDKEKQLNGWLGKGFYFSESKLEFKDYGNKLLSVFINVKNPFKVKGESPTDFLHELKKTFNTDYFNTDYFNTTKKLIDNNYDGVNYKHWDYEGRIFSCFNSNQIKLADGSNTTFDVNNPDIRFDLGGELDFEYFKKMSYDELMLHIKDSYKDLGAEIGIKGHTKDGEPIIGYLPYQNEYMYKSDSTGKNIRFYIDLGNKKYIHPSEINPKFNVSEQKRIEQKADYFAKISNEEYNKIISELDKNNELTLVVDTLEKALKIFNIENQYDYSDIFKSYGNSILESKDGNKRRMKFDIYYFRVNDSELKTNVKNLDLERFNNEYLKKHEFNNGGRTIAQTPAPKKERIYGSNINKQKSSESNTSAKQIVFDEKTLKSIKNKIHKHNEENPDNKITLSSAKAVVRRGMGAYSKSHRPTISGGKPNSRVAWGLARLNAFIYKIKNGVSKSGKYIQDDDLINELNIKYNIGGEISKQSINNVKNDKINYLNVLNSVWSFFGIKLD